MKELAKLVRFDLLTVGRRLMGGLLIILSLVAAVTLFLFPFASVYIVFLPLGFIAPLESIAEKSGFNKLYGTLPVKRENIPRARFLYIFLFFLAGELAAFLLAGTAFAADLWRFLPEVTEDMRTIREDLFKDVRTTLTVILAAFAAVCVVCALTTMLVKIFGAENSGKMMLAGVTLLLLLGFAFIVLNSMDLLPVLELHFDRNAELDSGWFVKCIITNIAVFGLCLGMGELTVKKTAGREL